MTRSLETVKREIRILGIDTCRTTEIFGAVTRGGSFLDGVVRFSLGRYDAVQELASNVRASRYYPELRVLMIHDLRRMIERTRLENLVDLPVIMVSRSQKSSGLSVFNHARRKLYYQSSLPVSTISRILNVTWCKGPLPEPARIAHVLARRVGPRARVE